VKSETADHAHFSCLDVSVTTHAVDLRRRLALVDNMLTWLGEGQGTLIKARRDTCRSSAISERILAISRGLGSVQCRP